ncbi:hypothetical protein ABID39_000864 [Bartonella japonica]|uniref:Uncharacterized protein n=1 Tax=Bartonella japonica TaxID=357761 RepID=A0ABV2FNT4_9HYPH
MMGLTEKYINSLDVNLLGMKLNGMSLNSFEEMSYSFGAQENFVVAAFKNMNHNLFSYTLRELSLDFYNHKDFNIQYKR